MSSSVYLNNLNSDEVWQSPFPKHVVDAVRANRDVMPSPGVIRSFGKLLRLNRQVWDECVRHLCSPEEVLIGSMVSELTVFVDLDGAPHVTMRTDDVAVAQRSRVFQDMIAVLCRRGLNARYASVMAMDVLREASAKNARIIGAFRTLMTDSKEHVFAFRVALKPLSHITPLPGNTRVMFADSHANCGVLDAVRKVVLLIEPVEDPAPVKNLRSLMFSVFQPDVFGYTLLCNFQGDTFVPGFAAVGDRLCTIWSALSALMCLKFKISSFAKFKGAIVWARRNRVSLLRQFFTHVTHVVKMLRVPLPVL